MISNLYFDRVIEQELYKIIAPFKDSAAAWDDLKSNMIKHIKESITTMSMTISLGLSCTNACMETFLKYSETIFKEMLMYMIMIYEILMICMCHMDDLI